MRVAIYAQHLLGTGHLVRMQQLAAALHSRGVDTTLIRGGLPPLPAPAADTDSTSYTVAQLPAVKCLPGDFTTLLDEGDRKVDDRFRTDRTQALLDTVAQINPDVLVIETWPFGRRQMEFEILPLLASLPALPTATRVVSSIRDILQLRPPKRRRQTLEQLESHISLVLVHGDPEFVSLARSFAETSQIACPVVYSGYIHGAEGESGLPLAAPGMRAGEVLVSVGGGAAGERLLTASLVAALNDDRPWRILAGSHPDPGRLAALRAEVANASGRVIVEENRSDFQALLAHCAVSVSQYGYNTALDLCTAGCAAVVVPYADDGETEQAMRADLFAEKKLVRPLPADQLTPESLTAAINGAVKPVAGYPLPKMDGADRTAEILINQFNSQPES